jgi:hypothetical protein
MAYKQVHTYVQYFRKNAQEERVFLEIIKGKKISNSRGITNAGCSMEKPTQAKNRNKLRQFLPAMNCGNFLPEINFDKLYQH